MKDQTERRYDNGHHRRNKYQLSCSVIGQLFLLASKIVGTYHCTSGGQSKKSLDNEHIDGIHQGYGGNRCGPQMADHKSIHTSHKRIQKLIQGQRDQKGSQFLVVKQKVLRFLSHNILSRL